ncbi:cytochrome c oxidase subunit 7A2, mitochondrial-like [Candoia aspera]|uniref:cytochrome c oxidase subunit 7A2, mitochondrial-like n=1 Tax=Candoia aspera TaxID=51853 RepID=UPI002FD867B3
MRSLLVAHIQSLRCFTTTSARQMKNRVPEYQKIFQADNDLPVHLKRGTTDMLMYRITIGISTLATSYAIYSLYLLGRPKKHN